MAWRWDDREGRIEHVQAPMARRVVCAITFCGVDVDDDVDAVVVVAASRESSDASSTPRTLPFAFGNVEELAFTAGGSSVISLAAEPLSHWTLER